MSKPTLTATQRELRTLSNTCKNAADRAELAANAAANHLMQLQNRLDYITHLADATREFASRARLMEGSAADSARTARLCMFIAITGIVILSATILTLYALA